MNPSDSFPIMTVRKESDFPSWAPRDTVARFFHETMAPYEDTLDDVQRALDYCFDKEKGGYLNLVPHEGKLAAALLMLNTGMKGYVPEHILLFVTVDPSLRGKGVGGILIQKSIAMADGPVKLHVEYDNPAKRLYERIGFTSKYAEMRYFQ